MTLASQFNVQYSASQQGVHTIAEPTFEPRIQLSLSFEDGVGLNQADLQYVQERSLSGGASETYDLAAGLLDAFNQGIIFAEIVGILITTAATNASNLQVGGAATTAWFGFLGSVADKVIIPPGGLFAIASPGDPGIGAVTGSAKSLLFQNSSATVALDYSLAILGRSQ